MAVKYATVVLKPSLCTLSGRSRDNLPDPVQDDDNNLCARQHAGRLAPAGAPQVGRRGQGAVRHQTSRFPMKI
jgi:hypothetical protein